MADDWKDALGALLGAGTLPEGDPGTSTAHPSAPGTKEKSAPRPILTLHYEKKGRAGKPATIIAGFPEDDDAEALATARVLKQRIGCGGSARGGEILLQGDRREQARRLLCELGYRVRT